jgi:hypothetical protein
MQIELGDKVKDSVTGFTGIAVAVTKWLHGCDRVTVRPEGVNKEGKPYDNYTFDALQLEIVKKRAVKAENAKTTRAKTTGGPRDDRAALRRQGD